MSNAVPSYFNLKLELFELLAFDIENYGLQIDNALEVQLHHYVDALVASNPHDVLEAADDKRDGRHRRRWQREEQERLADD